MNKGHGRRAFLKMGAAAVAGLSAGMKSRAALGSEMILSRSRAQALRYLLRHPASLRRALKAGYLGQSVLGKRPWALGWLLRRMKIDPDRRLPRLGPRAMETLPEITPAVGERKMKVAYFVGCGTDLLMPSVASDVVRVLSEAGAEVVVPTEQGCCGTPAITAGDLGTARELASRVVEQFSSLGVDAIVTACASCGHTLRYLYPEFMKTPTGVEVKDFSEVLAELGASPSARGSGLSEGMKATYHQPCHLNRGQGICDEPVSLLSGIDGLEYVEMKDADRCCGGAGLFSLYHGDLSRAIGLRKAAAITDSGADVVVTGCPSCIIQLEHLARVTGADWEVKHIAELLKG